MLWFNFQHYMDKEAPLCLLTYSTISGQEWFPKCTAILSKTMVDLVWVCVFVLYSIFNDYCLYT